MPVYTLVYDEVILLQLKKLGSNKHIQEILTKMFDKMEELGPRAGELIDSHLFIYEMKAKHPPIRLYYRHIQQTGDLYVFEYEMKMSRHKQQKTIGKIQSGIIKNPDPHV